MAEKVHVKSDCSLWVSNARAEKMNRKEGAREGKSKEHRVVEENLCVLTSAS